jgi:hypothetical protein
VYAPAVTDPSSPREGAIARAAFSAVLVALGLALLFVGARAIRARHWDTTVTVSRGVDLGPLAAGGGGRAAHAFEGADAQVRGAGMASFGALLVVWAIALVSTGSRPLAPRAGPLARLSAALYAAGAILLFPPWRIGRGCAVTVFWASVALWTAGLAALIRPGVRRRLRAIVPALFLLSLVVEMLVPIAASGGALLGLCVVLGGFMHAAFLVPSWRRRLALRLPASGRGGTRDEARKGGGDR